MDYNKVFIFLFVLTCFYGCVTQQNSQSQELTHKDHNEVILLVVQDILSDKNNIIIGTPCINGNIIFNKKTISPRGIFLDKFKEENHGYRYDILNLDSTYIRQNIDCEIKFCESRKDIYAGQGDVCGERPSFSISSIVKGVNETMSIFVFGNIKYHQQLVEYKVLNLKGKWNIELKYETMESGVLRENYEEFKKSTLKHF